MMKETEAFFFFFSFLGDPTSLHATIWTPPKTTTQRLRAASTALNLPQLHSSHHTGGGDLTATLLSLYTTRLV